MVETAYHMMGVLGLALVVLLGVVLTALQLPGTWLILMTAIIYDWCYQWDRLGPVMLGVMAGLAVLGEILEFVASFVFAGRAGGSRRAAWGGVIGGFIGMFLFTVPVPVLGTIVGGIIGCFAGAIIAEMTKHDDFEHSTRVGVGAALGRVAGMVGKLGIAFFMAGAAVSLAIFG
jgi:uncharacterized protein YqgC (DUF456 family)